MVQTSNGSQRSGVEQYNQYSQPGTSKGDESAPHFTPNQYNQILQLLNKSQITESSAHIAGTSLCNVADSNCLEWLVDSGASDHMVGTTSLLNHGLTVNNPGKVQLATRDSATITRSGNSKLTGGILTGRVKEIGKEKDGLYLLKTRKQNQVQGTKSLIAAKGCEE